MQIASHTAMRIHTVHALLATLLYLLFAPLISWAEVNTVPLDSIAPESALQSTALQIAPASLATMMKQMRYKEEQFLGDMLFSGESKIDKLFSSDEADKVFSSAGIQALAAEIASLAGKLKPRQAIAFKSELGRVKGYVFFAGQQSIWYFASIDGHPAHYTKKIEDESYLLDDPDRRWDNKVEKSYWQLLPQQDQSLYQNRVNWLNAPIKHIVAAPGNIATPQQSAPVRRKATAWVDASRSSTAATSAMADAQRGPRIKRLQKLLDKGLISAAEYDGKMTSIILEYNQSHPAIEDQLEFLKQLRDNNQITLPVYQSHRQALLEKL